VRWSATLDRATAIVGESAIESFAREVSHADIQEVRARGDGHEKSKRVPELGFVSVKATWTGIEIATMTAQVSGTKT
jgi:hypothetical protein